MVRAYDGPFVRSLNLKAMGPEINAEILYKAQILRARVVEVPAHLDWSNQAERMATRRVKPAGERDIEAVLVRQLPVPAALLLRDPGPGAAGGVGLDAGLGGEDGRGAVRCRDRRPRPSGHRCVRDRRGTLRPQSFVIGGRRLRRRRAAAQPRCCWRPSPSGTSRSCSTSRPAPSVASTTWWTGRRRRTVAPTVPLAADRRGPPPGGPAMTATITDRGRRPAIGPGGRPHCRDRRGWSTSASPPLRRSSCRPGWPTGRGGR